MDDESRTCIDEHEVLDVLIRIDRLGQDYWNRAQQPLAGTGSGYLNQAIGLKEASDMLRQILHMPRHGGFRTD